MDDQELINEIEFLRDENKRLTNEAEYFYALRAKSNMFDILLAKSYFSLNDVMDNLCELDAEDRYELRKMWKK